MPLEDEGGSSSAIVGGKETSESQAVGYLQSVIATKRFPAHCTGTLVAPRLVLTAAHCVDTETKWMREGSKPYLHFGLGAVADEQTIEVKEIVQHPSWKGFDEKQKDIGRHDVAYLVLAEAAPSRVSPMTIRERAHAGGCGLLSLGYGIADDGYDVDKGIAAKDSGRRQSLPQCASKGLVNGAIEVSSPKGATCQGDSGGPLLAADGKEMLGVLSYGVTTRGVGCGPRKRTYYAPVVENEDFLEAAFAAARAPSSPSPSPDAGASGDEGSTVEPPPVEGKEPAPPSPPEDRGTTPQRTVEDVETPDPAASARGADDGDDADDASDTRARASSGCHTWPRGRVGGDGALLLAAFGLVVARLARRRPARDAGDGQR